VYGDRRIFDPVAAYGMGAELAARAQFCGYVVNRLKQCVEGLPETRAWTTPRREWPVVVATAGGGSDGTAIIEAFLAAAYLRPWSAMAVAGPLAPPAPITRSGGGGIPLYRFLPEMQRIIETADALVCMGGYNTLAEALASGTPVVCVPRLEPRSEQLLRATVLSRMGLVELLLPSELTPEALSGRIESVVIKQRRELRQRAEDLMSFNGADQAAAAILACGGHRPFNHHSMALVR